MGKWSQVRCSCSNQTPRSNSSWSDRPYQKIKYKKLSNRQKQEIKAWKANVENMYNCGHINRMLVQLYPGKIIELGYVLKQVFRDDSLTFEIFNKVGDRRNYFSQVLNEELRVSPQEAELWLMEVEELEGAFSRQGNLPYNSIQDLILILYKREIRSDRDLKQQIESIADSYSFARIVPFINNFACQTKSLDVFLKEQFDVLNNIKQLCQAAIETGNPIELLW